LVDLASEGLKLRRGDWRLIGWTDGAMPGMTILPAAAQETRRTLFIVHLRHGRLPEAKPDINTMFDFMEERPTADLDVLQEMTAPGEGNRGDSAPAVPGTTGSGVTPGDSQ
jgi:hypothetical protein